MEYEIIEIENGKICVKELNFDGDFNFKHLKERELENLNAFKNENRKKIYSSIREMSKMEGIDEILYDDNGKPYSKSHKISITHSGNWIGLRLSEIDGGIDIEKVGNRILKIADRFLSKTEQKEICQNDISKMVLCWSAKEAIFKKHGGNTTFFKKNQEIIFLKDDLIRIKFKESHHFYEEELKIKKLAANYNLVYTL